MAKEMMDIGIDDREDLAFLAGDLSITESTAAHQKQLIFNNKGDFKQNPTICVGVFEYLEDEGSQNLIRQISVEFSKDGMDVKRVSIDRDGVIKSDAVYN